jgi:WhiB family redox-sensing transcriptional regulator
MRWQDHAACRTVDPELFFEGDADSPRNKNVIAAKKVCRTCPVARQCLVWALKSREPVGVWGGMSSRERTMLISRSNRS